MPEPILQVMQAASCGVVNYSVVGLVLDVVGVAFLSADLIRLQRAIRRRGKDGRARFDELESEYGGIESWASELMEKTRWVPEHAYSDRHLEEEVSYSARRAVDTLSDLASAANGLAAQLTGVAGVLRSSAEEDERLASMSVRLSVVGVAFLLVGFLLQIVGAVCG